MYRRSRSKATASGYRTARQLATQDYPLFPALNADPGHDDTAQRAQLLSVIDAFRPATTGITAKPPKLRPKNADPPAAADDHVEPLQETEVRSRAPKAVTTKVCPGLRRQLIVQDFRDTAFYLPQSARVDEDKM